MSISIRIASKMTAVGLALVLSSGGRSSAQSPRKQGITAFIVPLTTKDFHEGFDLEIGDRASKGSEQPDSIADTSFAARVRDKIAELDTREWHEEYNLSKGTKAWAEFGKSEPILDSAEASRLVAGLSVLDTIPKPEDRERRNDLLRRSFPEWPDSTNDPFCGWGSVDLDGQPPQDIVATAFSGGSAGCYALHVVVRQHDKVTFQVLAGCHRGLLNMMYRIQAPRHEVQGMPVEARGTDSVFWQQSGYADSILIVEGVEKRFLILNNNLWWPGSSGIMTEMCDFPVPYFWDGEKLSWDPSAAKVFYEKLSRSLHLLSPPDSEVIATAITRVL